MSKFRLQRNSAQKEMSIIENSILKTLIAPHISKRGTNLFEIVRDNRKVYAREKKVRNIKSGRELISLTKQTFEKANFI